MRMTLKKVLACLLAALVTLPATACSTSNEDTRENRDTTVQTQAGTAGGEQDFPNIEKQNYGGETFRMIGWNTQDWYYAEEYGTSTGAQGILDETIYESNLLVKEYLNINMALEECGDGNGVLNKVQPSIMAGDDAYQLCIMHPYQGITSFITQNFALDFYELPDFDIDQPYWNASVMENLAINGHAYIGMGDLCKYTLIALYGNKDLLKDVNMQMPYDQVRGGTWTLDLFTSMTAGLYADNGDGNRNNLDTYGFASVWDVNGAAFLEASGFYVVTRNEEERFELSLYNDRLVELYDRVLSWTQSEDVYIWGYGSRGDPGIYIDFLENRSYFTLEGLGTQYLEATFSVGILPLPKYDANQQSYAHVNWGNNLIVPSTVQNKDMVGQALELMSYYTQNKIRTKYYDEVLQLRVSEAPDDREMVELISDTVVFDPGIAYCDGSSQLFNLVYILALPIVQGNSNIASYYKQNNKAAQKKLNSLFLE